MESCDRMPERRGRKEVLQLGFSMGKRELAGGFSIIAGVSSHSREETATMKPASSA